VSEQNDSLDERRTSPYDARKQRKRNGNDRTTTDGTGAYVTVARKDYHMYLLCTRPCVWLWIHWYIGYSFV